MCTIDTFPPSCRYTTSQEFNTTGKATYRYTCIILCPHLNWSGCALLNPVKCTHSKRSWNSSATADSPLDTTGDLPCLLPDFLRPANTSQKLDCLTTITHIDNQLEPLLTRLTLGLLPTTSDNNRSLNRTRLATRLGCRVSVSATATATEIGGGEGEKKERE